MADLPTSLDQNSKAFGEELEKLIMPAMSVIEAALQSSDPKLKIETAKWVLSCFPETAPKKVRDSDGNERGGTTVNLNFNMEKLKQIAEGAKKIQNADYKILSNEKRLPIYSERKGANENDSHEA